MKITHRETVIRYHVVFSANETLALVEIGWLPPTALGTEADLWLTLEDIEEYKMMGLLNSAEADAALIKANEEYHGGVH